MNNYLESLPEELIELIYKHIHVEKYKLVLHEIKNFSIDMIVKNMVDEIIDEAIYNIN